jgi:hypothetical protein
MGNWADMQWHWRICQANKDPTAATAEKEEKRRLVLLIYRGKGDKEVAGDFVTVAKWLAGPPHVRRRATSTATPATVRREREGKTEHVKYCSNTCHLTFEISKLLLIFH